jgi:NADH-quinone oxidoreductase subunit K
VFGVLVARNALGVFMCVELMLNASNLTFLAFARDAGIDVGHLRRSSSSPSRGGGAIGLAVIIAVFRSRGTVNVDDIRTMRL